MRLTRAQTPGSSTSTAAGSFRSNIGCRRASTRSPKAHLINLREHDRALSHLSFAEQMGPFNAANEPRG